MDIPSVYIGAVNCCPFPACEREALDNLLKCTWRTCSNASYLLAGASDGVLKVKPEQMSTIQ